MGQAAEDIIIGLVCQSCGCFIDGDAPGYPRNCDECDNALDVHDDWDEDE